ncbi:hypothetical protein M422DRAFT_188251, partial [Sphaerobolus stellatus SS14]
LNSITAINLHISNSRLPSDYLLFTYQVQERFIPLMKSAFLARCNAIWMSRGFPRFTGHSFRIGGTIELFSSGVHPDVVRALSHQSSDAFLVYWCCIDDIAPIHIAKLPGPTSNT